MAVMVLVCSTAAGPKVVLQGVSGQADHGTLHALMGPSGAGKSSLMDILAQRKQVGNLTGQVLLGGQPANPRSMAQRSAYVPQDDNFMPTLSAEETLGFYAAMTLPPRLSAAARRKRAAEVLAVVGLSHCTHTMVGGHLPGGLTLRGLSGGERKRLAIAVGLLAAPSLLFLDEPTSGLDSFAALTVLRYIRTMADEAGHVVVASIHQPRSAIWAMFDAVTVLSKGMLMYTGPREAMVPWFTQQLPQVLDAMQRAHMGLASPLPDAPPLPPPPAGPAAAAHQLAPSGASPPSSPSADPSPRAATAGGDAVMAKLVDEQQAGTPPSSHVVVDVVGEPSSHAGSTSTTGGSSSGADVAKPAGWIVLPHFTYSPELHGVASDWVMDLVSVGFVAATPKHPVSEEGVDESCPSFRSVDELRAAAAAFLYYNQTISAARAKPANGRSHKALPGAGALQLLPAAGQPPQAPTAPGVIPDVTPRPSLEVQRQAAAAAAMPSRPALPGAGLPPIRPALPPHLPATAEHQAAQAAAAASAHVTVDVGLLRHAVSTGGVTTTTGTPGARQQPEATRYTLSHALPPVARRITVAGEAPSPYELLLLPGGGQVPTWVTTLYPPPAGGMTPSSSSEDVEEALRMRLERLYGHHRAGSTGSAGSGLHSAGPSSPEMHTASPGRGASPPPTTDQRRTHTAMGSLGGALPATPVTKSLAVVPETVPHVEHPGTEAPGTQAWQLGMVGVMREHEGPLEGITPSSPRASGAVVAPLMRSGPSSGGGSSSMVPSTPSTLAAVEKEAGALLPVVPEGRKTPSDMMQTFEAAQRVATHGGSRWRARASTLVPACCLPAGPSKPAGGAAKTPRPAWVSCASCLCCCCLGMPTGLLRWLTHLRALLWRESAAITRNPADVAGRMLTFAWIGVFTGLVFYNIPMSAESMQLRLNVHFANTAFFLLMPYISMSLYTADRQYYLSDMGARLYKPLTYYLAKVMATLPFNILSAIVYCLIIYGMTGLRHGRIYTVQTTAITGMVSLIAMQVLHVSAVLAPNQDLAFMMAIAWTALNLLLSGFFITYEQFAFNWLSHLRWLSAQGYAFEGLAGVELRGAMFNCSSGVDQRALDLLPSLLPDTPLAQSSAAQNVLAQPGQECIARADALLDYFGLHRAFGPTLGILLAYWAIVHILTYIALLLASRAERR